ncbi:DarT ssDNA thymidine ADP-ribosyltransferase family protein [Prevotella denticola]|uniref:DarT ssDNA thymidine ADP-ribosyltransferase family protein n=1 Tax=Prevotella denticola TaxID=28129 RepID=UPI003C74D7C1
MMFFLSTGWSKEEDKDFKRRKEAELLVLDELGTQYIKGLVVYNRKAMEMLIQMGVSEDLIAIRQSFYY